MKPLEEMTYTELIEHQKQVEEMTKVKQHEALEDKAHTIIKKGYVSKIEKDFSSDSWHIVVTAEGKTDEIYDLLRNK